MIKPTATFEVKRIPLCDLFVTECQERYPERAMHYVELMRARPTDHPGFLSVAPDGDRYRVLDGHHRFCAHILTGRSEALCVVIHE